MVNIGTHGVLFDGEGLLKKYKIMKRSVDFLLLFGGRRVLDASYATTICCLVENKVWSTISSLVIWVLWKARCKCVFQKVKQNSIELVKKIWLMLLHSLRGQYEAITSEPMLCFVSNNILEKCGQRSSPLLRRD